MHSVYNGIMYIYFNYTDLPLYTIHIETTNENKIYTFSGNNFQRTIKYIKNSKYYFNIAILGT